MIYSGVTRSPVLSGKFFVCAASGSSQACFSPVFPIAVSNSKNIHNRSIHCNSVRSSSSNVGIVSKPEYAVFSSSDSVTNISQSPKFSLSNLHTVGPSTSSFRAVTHRNTHLKRKLHKSVIGPSLVKSGNNDDISNNFIVGKNNINILIKPGNNYISSVFFLSALLWEFSVLLIFINNNYFLESNKKYIFRDTNFIHNPLFAFWAIYFQTNLSNAFNNLYSFRLCNIFENLVHFFSCRFYHLNLFFDIEYFLETPQFSELPSFFNSVTSIEFVTNHLLHFMVYTQLNSIKDTPYFCTPKKLYDVSSLDMRLQYYWICH